MAYYEIKKYNPSLLAKQDISNLQAEKAMLENLPQVVRGEVPAERADNYLRALKLNYGDDRQAITAVIDSMQGFNEKDMTNFFKTYVQGKHTGIYNKSVSGVLMMTDIKTPPTAKDIVESAIENAAIESVVTRPGYMRRNDIEKKLSEKVMNDERDGAISNLKVIERGGRVVGLQMELNVLKDSEFSALKAQSKTLSDDKIDGDINVRAMHNLHACRARGIELDDMFVATVVVPESKMNGLIADRTLLDMSVEDIQRNANTLFSGSASNKLKPHYTPIKESSFTAEDKRVIERLINTVSEDVMADKPPLDRKRIHDYQPNQEFHKNEMKELAKRFTAAELMIKSCEEEKEKIAASIKHKLETTVGSESYLQDTALNLGNDGATTTTKTKFDPVLANDAEKTLYEQYGVKPADIRKVEYDGEAMKKTLGERFNPEQHTKLGPIVKSKLTSQLKKAGLDPTAYHIPPEMKIILNPQYGKYGPVAEKLGELHSVTKLAASKLIDATANHELLEHRALNPNAASDAGADQSESADAVKPHKLSAQASISPRF